jgi:DNA-binding GntR family transcriptional regulator
VKNIPCKGALVANPPSKKEVVIIFKIRIWSETELVNEAMQHLGDQQITELENLHHEMELMESGFYNLDRKFHSIICAASQQTHP